MSGSPSPIRAESARTNSDQLIKELKEVRQRTLELVSDLSDEQMIGPRLAIVNPLRWEFGHLAWFQEHWVLCHLRGLPPLLSNGDSFYDSARVAHDTRWDLPLPSKDETLEYMQRILERITEEHGRGGTPANVNGYDETYFLELSLMHECMHAEAFTYTRQTLAYPPPALRIVKAATQAPQRPGTGGATQGAGKLGDVHIPGGAFELGSAPRASFVFDNEQWAHPVSVAPFTIARCAVTNAEFAAFVEDGGYRRSELWTADGWGWRESTRAEHPVYWQREPAGRWLRRNFDSFVPLEDRLPALQVNWYEASAYCRWAKRRLPTEAEWEMAASAEPGSQGEAVSHRKRAFPWGDDATPERANLDSRAMGCVEVDALPAGDTGFGCRQMIGNTWEWTASDFGPYPGFVPGPYKEYSEPWFGDHKVLRGGCWATSARLIRNTYRNFYRPERRDVWAGFRTCAI